jgi:hypothetical protein
MVSYLFNMIISSETSNLRQLNQVNHWSRQAYFKEFVLGGLAWYIQVALVHSGHLSALFNLDQLESNHPLKFHIYREASRLYSMFYHQNHCSDFGVVDCVGVYLHMNELSGQIQSYNKQSGQYTVAIIPSETDTWTSNKDRFIACLFPHYMDPLQQSTKKDMINSSQEKDVMVVTLPNF